MTDQELQPVQFTASMHIGTRQEAPGAWVAWCPSLDLYTQAGSQDDAVLAIREATILWFQDCARRDTLDAALREGGVSPGMAGQRACRL